MGDVQVKGATMSGGRVERLRVGIDRLPDRTIGRDEAIRWMRDGHSLVPLVAGARRSALQLVEVGEGFSIRADNQPLEEDSLPDLPPA